MADPKFTTELASLLEQVTAPNSEIIKAASSKLQKEYYTEEQCVPALISILQQSPSQQIRQLAAVEVRKRILPYWETLDGALRSQIRSSIVQSTLNEPAAIVRHASSRVISEIAKLDMPNNEWPELPAYVHKAATSTSANEREIGVYILYSLLENMDAAFSSRLGELFAIFSQTISDPDSQAVRTDTMLALGKVAEILDSDGDSDSEYITMFRQFLPGMVNVLKQLIENGDSKALDQAFEAFQSLLWVNSSIIGKSLGDLMQFMLEIAQNSNFDDSVRSLALQFLTNAVRYKRMKVQGLKIGPLLTSTALQLAGDTMEAIDDEEDEDSVPRLALRFVETLSSTLPPSQVMNTLIVEIPKYLSSPNSNYRRAGLLSMSVAVEGAPEYVSTQIKLVLPVIVQGLQDPVLEVRVAALHALSQLADHLDDAISKEHEILLPLVFNMMDTSDSKVAKASCTALDAMVQNMEEGVMAQYLPTLMSRLLSLLAQPVSDVSVKGPIITAIGATAHSSKKQFLTYFNTAVHSFEPFLAFTEGDKELDVKAMAFDALGAMASSVGEQAFTPFAQPLVEAAYGCFQITHSRLRESVYYFFGILAKVYGRQFAPFLPRLMPEICKSLEQDETGFDQHDDVEIGDVDDVDPWENIQVNSALAIEKEIATDVVGDLAAGTKEDFIPYLDEVSKILIGLVSHFYEDIRRAAVGSLWQTVGVVYEAAHLEKWQPGLPVKVPLPDAVLQYAHLVRSATLEAFDEEDDRIVAMTICDNLAEIIRLCGPAIIADDTEPIATQVLAILKKSHRSQTMDDEPEEEEAEDAAESDVQLIDSAMDVVVSLAAALGPDFTNYFKTFCPIFLKYCSSSSDGERKSGVGALAEIVNGLKGSITPWSSQLLKSFLHRLPDESVEVRSNAVYGLGLLSEFSQSADEIVAVYPKIFQKLQQLLVSDVENFRSVGNICGCVARMTYSHPERVPLSDVLPPLVYSLPLKDAFEENDPIYRLIVQLYKNQDPTVQGLTERILQALETVFGNESTDNKQFESDEIRTSVIELLRYINQSNPGMIPADSSIARAISA
ncbi:armadillo-type protein [Limtongia smithiae]|uniref:armadillo-type protein n=1 Tax=Limtongia smithiae TaxID=1125753 RepID=UPI0034CF5CB5